MAMPNSLCAKQVALKCRVSLKMYIYAFQNTIEISPCETISYENRNCAIRCNVEPLCTRQFGVGIVAV